MRFIRGFLNFFTTITVCILIVVAISCSLGDYDGMSESILWDILLSGAVTALVTAAVYSVEFKSKKHFVFMTAVHYLLLSAVMIFLAANFGWISLDIGGALGMMFDVAVVYVMVFIISYIISKKEADKLNDALEKKYRDR